MSEPKETKPELTLEQRLAKRKGSLVILLVVLCVVLIVYFALGAVYSGIGLGLFILQLVFKPVTG